MIKQFSYDDIEKSTSGKKFLFTGAMVRSCQPLFDDCDSNYAVVDKLAHAGVITGACEDDTEYSQMWLYFKRKDTARSFIDRLNKYLREKSELLEKAKRF